MEAGSISGNTAGHGVGAGIRASMGSDAQLEGLSVLANKTKGKKAQFSGGGGIGCRNVSLSLGGNCKIDSNETAEWAGGGALLTAVSEGALAGIPDLWHAILLEVFGFTRVEVKVAANTTVTHNTAGSGRVVTSAKGGGYYILRGAFRDAPDLRIAIEEFRRNVSGNHAKAGTFSSKLTGRSITTEQVDLVDEHAKVDDGDAEVGKHLGSWNPFSSLASTTFHYES
jgi:hypothetical protein